jgi:hypothetical protein
VPGEFAALIEGWPQQFGEAWPAGSTLGVVDLPPFPQRPLATSVAIYVDGSWIDITEDVYGGDRATLEITRGRSSEAGQVEASRLTGEINNRGGKYSPRNPTSILYGKIGRNTPIRVLVDGDYRFTGEIPAWPQRWDTTGNDVWVPFEAAGIMRRLGQGATPLKSAPYRYATTLKAAGIYVAPAAYWPLDDLTRANFGAPGIGAYPFKLRASGSSSVKPGEGELATWLPNGVKLEETTLGTALDGIVIGPATQKVAVDVVQREDGAGVTSWAVYSKDGLTIWRVRFDPTINEVSVLLRTGGSGSAESTIATATVASISDKQMHAVRLELVDSATDVNYFVYVDGVNVIAATRASVNNAGCSQLRLIGTTSSGSTSISYGHVAVWLADPSHVAAEVADYARAVFGYTGEPAGIRIQRLCTEEGIPFRGRGTMANTVPLGPQYADTLLNIAREAADTDLGLLYEPREGVGLAYRAHTDLYNQAATLALDYTRALLDQVPEPVDDDQFTRNDVTAQRRDGSSERTTLTVGALSTLAPPSGVGVYDDSVTVNVPGDGKFLDDQAGFRLHLGTVDEPRYPTIAANLANPRWAVDLDLTSALAMLELGDRLTIANMPTWVSPDQVSQLAAGFVETLRNFERKIAVNCAPESPWRVLVYQAAAGSTVHKYDTGGSTLAADISSGATTLSVATATSHPVWTTAAGEMGFDIWVGGERMTVTGISGASSPQSFTVTRSVNGVVKTQAAGTVVRLWQTPTWAL